MCFINHDNSILFISQFAVINKQLLLLSLYKIYSSIDSSINWMPWQKFEYHDFHKFWTDRSRQKVQTQTRVPIEEQSNQGYHLLHFFFHLLTEVPCGKTLLWLKQILKMSKNLGKDWATSVEKSLWVKKAWTWNMLSVIVHLVFQQSEYPFLIIVL